ncbi:MAG TPA: competence/damage-inducible protein A [Bacteroidetes bacterium]|nr:competence/damage-inducible protein A [Bacteroidota bacterium]
MKNTLEKNAYLITIGDELLIGQVTDTNSKWIAEQLTGLGIKVKRIISVQDEEQEIIDALDEATDKADIIITTGGLGPTVDDITKKTFAKFLHKKMIFNQNFFDKVKEYVKKRGHKIDDMLFNYSHFPEGTIFLKNSVGSAPGMLFNYKGKKIFALPGVPPEMKSIFTEEIEPILKKDNNGFYIIKKTVLTSGEIEAALAEKLKDIVNDLPQHISFAYLPNLGRVRLRITAKGEDKEILEKEVESVIEKIKNRIGEYIFGYDDDTLEHALGVILKNKGLTLATAESCTGGMIAHKITSVPGSSEYFKGSIVAYSNEIKEKILNVQHLTLQNHGAVSEETVIEMVKGAIKVIETDLAIASSGIAGPSGGTPTKPVGTIWIAAGNKDKIVTKKLQLGNNRIKNIETSTVFAMDLLRKFLI